MPVLLPYAPIKVDSDMDAEKWNDLVTLGTSILAAVTWFYRKTLKALFIWFWNALKAPSRIEELYKQNKLTENQAALSLALARVTWRTIDRPIWQSDAHGMCIHANEFMLRILAMQEEEILGMGWQNIIHADDKAAVDREWSNAVKFGRDFAFKYRWVTSSGVEIPIFARAFRLLNNEGDLLGWVGFVTLIDHL